MTTRTFLAAIVTPISLAALFADQQHPALFLWYVGIGLLLAGVSGFAAAYQFRAERDEAREEIARRDREHAAEKADLEAEAQRLHVELTEAQIAGGVVLPLPRRWTHVPDLTIVPPQRDGEHDDLPVADYPFPVHTAVDDDDIEALIRTTEEK